MAYEMLTKKHLNRLKEKLSTALAKHSHTGAAQGSLEVRGSQLLGSDYIYFLAYGRKPGKFPPVDKQRKWVADKLGVAEKRVNSVAYLIGRKIANEGTAIYRAPNTGVPLNKLVEQTLEDLQKELPEAVSASALTFIYGTNYSN